MPRTKIWGKCVFWFVTQLVENSLSWWKFYIPSRWLCNMIELWVWILPILYFSSNCFFNLLGLMIMIHVFLTLIILYKIQIKVQQKNFWALVEFPSGLFYWGKGFYYVNINNSICFTTFCFCKEISYSKQSSFKKTNIQKTPNNNKNNVTQCWLQLQKKKSTID